TISPAWIVKETLSTAATDRAPEPKVLVKPDASSSGPPAPFGLACASACMHGLLGLLLHPPAGVGKRGQAPPSGNPPLSRTFGAPSAHRFASEAGFWRSREDGLKRRAKPMLPATRMPVCLSLHGRPPRPAAAPTSRRRTRGCRPCARAPRRRPAAAPTPGTRP